MDEKKTKTDYRRWVKERVRRKQKGMKKMKFRKSAKRS